MWAFLLFLVLSQKIIDKTDILSLKPGFNRKTGVLT